MMQRRHHRDGRLGSAGLHGIRRPLHDTVRHARRLVLCAVYGAIGRRVMLRRRLKLGETRQWNCPGEHVAPLQLVRECVSAIIVIIFAAIFHVGRWAGGRRQRHPAEGGDERGSGSGTTPTTLTLTLTSEKTSHPPGARPTYQHRMRAHDDDAFAPRGEV